MRKFLKKCYETNFRKMKLIVSGVLMIILSLHFAHYPFYFAQYLFYDSKNKTYVEISGWNVPCLRRLRVPSSLQTLGKINIINVDQIVLYKL